jgi:3-phenylpropionate/cinnamic acid dioxygenase small subunit
VTTRAEAAPAQTVAARTTSGGGPTPLLFGDARFGLLYQWLVEEAALLDQHRYEEWLSRLADDLDYRVPIRQVSDQSRPAESGFGHFAETKASLATRVRRLEQRNAWAETPATATRRFVSNLRAQVDGDDLLASSYFLLIRNHGGRRAAQQVMGERHDRLRQDASGWKLVGRLVELDQTSLPVTNLAIFL